MSKMIERFKGFSKQFETAMEQFDDLMGMADSMLSSVRMNDMRNMITEKFASAYDKIDDALQRIKTISEDHIVSVPFDNETSTFTFHAKGNTLRIVITANEGDSTSEHSFVLPESIDVTNMRQTYDKEKKTLFFKFGKK